jgi:hypothetical protein
MAVIACMHLAPRMARLLRLALPAQLRLSWPALPTCSAPLTTLYRLVLAHRLLRLLRRSRRETYKILSRLLLLHNQVLLPDYSVEYVIQNNVLMEPLPGLQHVLLIVYLFIQNLRITVQLSLHHTGVLRWRQSLQPYSRIKLGVLFPLVLG